MSPAPAPSYTTAQRRVALAYGLGSHALFLASVVVMFFSLYHGLSFGLIKLHGWAAVLDDTLLVGQFALGHSFLLSDRGRRFMARLAPLGLGRDLSTTIFAGLASLQLLLTFLLWAPSEVMWAAPEGALRQGLSVLYGVSWVLLARAMSDAGLDTQIGITGWYSIWSGRKPVYRPFTRTGLFRYCRQPIYLSFSLILWTAPDWTPDHLLVALAWTGYCVVAPIWKERRYLRYYGAAYERYQARVPYWFPTLRQRNKPAAVTPISNINDPAVPAVLIIGAGPVGMLLGCLLGRRGIPTVIVEKRVERPVQSQAIGITPPSLAILAEVGLDEAFVRQGLPIRECHVHGVTGRVGTASFREIEGPYRYILSLPQRQSMARLEERLASFSCVQVRRGWEVVAVAQDESAAEVRLRTPDGEEETLRAAWVVACDGARSKVRDLLKLRTRRVDYGHHFVMGDFTDHSPLGEEAHLYFTPTGAVESFPLPGGIRRWIVQTDTRQEAPERDLISQVVRERTGLALDSEDQLNVSPFSPWRLDCEQIHDGRFILCGDAAHVMSPIGGQGMNTGFADAEFAAALLEAVVKKGAAPGPWLAAYDRCRRRAAAAAATRAALGMGLGTWRGVAASYLRDWVLRHLILQGPLASAVGPWFAMKTIPFGRLSQCPVPGGSLRPSAAGS